MKKSLHWIVLIFGIICLACEPAVIFQNPPPQHVKASNTFAPAYRGTYFCDYDSSVVVLGERVIYKTQWLEFSVPKRRIQRDSRMEKVGSTLNVEDLGKCEISRIQNDTVYASIQLKDTLFYLDGVECILKEYKGHQILSLWHQQGKYEVFILSLDEEANIVLSMASLPGSLQALEKITPIKDVSSAEVEQYEINPSLKEFDEILAKEIVFESCEYFRRIRLPKPEKYFY